ncbi:DcaP family trimeric outer membrane transporter [Flammeovirga aprica]|uniref:SH3b domain-containing protein n=1 Tax=Flammeovirga aprica JL-4 TaxID=694437 RepID=A0A7X9P082_9BACT|nr:DcaP family trimeric outer membrane transporter [Flammeovirga aprica]NME66622.1 hypothetical protein [Flammeovirga aprica JL-4]
MKQFYAYTFRFLILLLMIFMHQNVFGQWMRSTVEYNTYLRDHRSINSPALMKLEKGRDILSLPLHEESQFVKVWDYQTGKRGFVLRSELSQFDTLAKAALVVPDFQGHIYRPEALLHIENIEEHSIIVEIDQYPYEIPPYKEIKLVLTEGQHGIWAYRDGALPFWGDIALKDSSEYILQIKTTKEEDVIIADIEPVEHIVDTVIVEDHYEKTITFLPKIKIDTTKIVDNKHPQDLEISRLPFDVRGYVKLNSLYDFHGLSRTGGFPPYDIPVGKDNKLNTGFYMSARQSRLGISSNILTDQGYIRFYLEADFIGGGNALDYFRLRHAYVQYGYLTIGQTWTTFTDLFSTPLTVDNEGPSSSSSTRQGLIRYEKKVGKSENEFAISLETPTKTFSDTIAVDQRQLWPDVASRYKVTMPRGQIQVAGIVRVLSQHNPDDQVISKMGFGMMISGKNTFKEKHKIYYQIIGGRGVTRYISAFSSYNLDAVASPDNDIYVPFTAGGYFTYEYYFKQNIFLNLVNGVSWIDNSEWQPGNTFEKSYYTSANLFWFPFERCRTGVSVVQGERFNKDGQRGSAWRFQMYIRYDI